MKFRYCPFVIVGLLFVLAASGCNLAGAGTPAPAIDTNIIVQTSLAGTLSAQPTTTNPPAPSETPVPPVIVEPSPTLSPEPTQAQPPAPAVLRLAYIKDGNVYVWTEGQGSVGLTGSHNAVSVRISPDGQRIAYVRQDPINYYEQELWVVNSVGLLDDRPLVSAADLAALKAASPYTGALGMGFLQIEWKPGTHILAYQTYPIFEGPGSAVPGDLRLVDVDSLQKTTVLEFGQGGMFYYSPDGSQVALSYPDHINLMNADGSNLRHDLITFPQVITYSEYQYHPHPIWAADSTSLRVTIPPADPMLEPLPPTGLWSISTGGSPGVLLGNIQAMPFDWPNNAFSPDLTWVAYVEPLQPREQNLRVLHVSHPDGTGEFRMAENTQVRFVTWTPASTRFVYSVSNGDGKGMYLGDLSGGNTMITSDPSMLREMSWVDGSRFAYFSKVGSGWELRISDVDGTNHAFIDTITGDVLALDFTR